MSDSAGTAAADASATPVGGPSASLDRNPSYRERLYLPWWGWPLPLFAAVLLAAEVHMGYPGVRAWLPYVITIPVTALLLWRLGRMRVALQDGELQVGDAHLPVRFIGEIEQLSGIPKRKALGPELDPVAFVEHRGWVPSVLRLELIDPEDPTPYWVFSTRRPAELAELLRAASGHSGSGRDGETGAQDDQQPVPESAVAGHEDAGDGAVASAESGTVDSTA